MACSSYYRIPLQYTSSEKIISWFGTWKFYSPHKSPYTNDNRVLTNDLFKDKTLRALVRSLDQWDSTMLDVKNLSATCYGWGLWNILNWIKVNWMTIRWSVGLAFACGTGQTDFDSYKGGCWCAAEESKTRMKWMSSVFWFSILVSLSFKSFKWIKIFYFIHAFWFSAYIACLISWEDTIIIF